MIHRFSSAAALLVLLASTSPAFAQDAPVQTQAAAPAAPVLVRVSGALLLPGGAPRTGSVMMVASVYATAEDTTPLWTEQQFIALADGGRYVLNVGASDPNGLPAELFTSETGRWVGVGVQGEPEHQRIALVSVPYAAKAGDATTLAGLSPSDFVLSPKRLRSAATPVDGVEGTVYGSGPISNTTFNDTLSVTGFGTHSFSSGGAGGNELLVANTTTGAGNYSQGTFTAGTASFILNAFSQTYTSSGSAIAGSGRMYTNGDGGLSLVANHPSGVLRIFTGGATERLRIDNAGNVGIGVTSPTAKLDVAGRLNVTGLGSHNFVAGGTGGNEILLSNTTTGPANWAQITVTAGTSSFILNAFPQTYTTSGSAVAASGRMYTAGDGGMSFVANNPVASLRFYSGGSTERMRIDQSGNVGIGVTNPTAKLDVAGSINVSGNINAKYQDVAEWVETPKDLEDGTVVIVDVTANDRVVAAAKAYDTRVAGAVSRQPGLILGEKSDTKELIATNGRVRIKVDASYGAIKIGDLLVTSPTPGHAMLSRPITVGGQTFHRAGTLLGKALEALPNGKGEILVLLMLQ